MSKKIAYSISAGVGVVVLALVLGFVSYNATHKPVEEKKDNLSRLLLMLTVAPRDPLTSQSFMYAYPFSTTTPQTISGVSAATLPGKYPEEDVAAGFLSYSPDGECNTFITSEVPSTYSESIEMSTTTSIIVQACGSEGYILYNFAGDEHVSQPSINNKGDVLFHTNRRYPEEGLVEGIANANDYTIYYADNHSVKRTIPIARGVSPHWIRDGEFVFLKNDGVYLYSIEQSRTRRIFTFADGTETVFVPSEEDPDAFVEKEELKEYKTIAGNAMLDVAPQIGTIAVSIPDRNTVVILQLQGDQLDLVNTFFIKDVFAFWPQFSPDGEYLAFQTTEDPSNSQLHPKVVFYGSDGKKLDQEIDLSEYDVDYMFLTDWIK